MTPSIAELTTRFLAHSTEAPAYESPVEPYDVATAFRVEPATAWAETLFVLKALDPTAKVKMPAEWGSYVRNQPPARFIPMALGFFPQLVSDFARLYESKGDDSNERPAFIADTLKTIHESNPVAVNEQAADLWHAGRRDDAIAKWQTLSNSMVKAFNLGMAHSAIGQNDMALQQLTVAISHLPASSAWKFLAELYRSLATVEA
ncbi:hypothetical protein BH11PLA2_BH11PLA2_19360 [soil metagenome]